MTVWRAIYFAYVFSSFFYFLVVDIGAASSQELQDRFLSAFQGLVELCKGLINFEFIWQLLKDVEMETNESRKIGVFHRKIFFVALPFQVD